MTDLKNKFYAMSTTEQVSYSAIFAIICLYILGGLGYFMGWMTATLLNMRDLQELSHYLICQIHTQ